MPAPSNIKAIAKKPDGTFKILGTFPKPFPLRVEVVGANPADIEDVEGGSGTWKSNNFYSTLAQTLKVYEADGTTKTISYDASGNIVIGCFAQFVGVPGAIISGNSVTVSWGINAAASINLSYFKVQRSGTADGTFSTIADNVPSTQFSVADSNPLTDPATGAVLGFYRVVAICTTGATAATSDVAEAMVAGCSATFSGTPSAIINANSVIITWAIDETYINLDHFDVKRSGSSTGNFTNIATVAANKFTATDSNPLSDPATGAVIGFYKIVAICGNGSTAATSAVVEATQSV